MESPGARQSELKGFPAKAIPHDSFRCAGYLALGLFLSIEIASSVAQLRRDQHLIQPFHSTRHHILIYTDAIIQYLRCGSRTNWSTFRNCGWTGPQGPVRHYSLARKGCVCSMDREPGGRVVLVRVEHGKHQTRSITVSLDSMFRDPHSRASGERGGWR